MDEGVNGFVLNTGRSGSLTTAKAFAHATNYTSGHETRASRAKLTDRFGYPDQHIEADLRLSWMLGALDLYYPPEKAKYVWLQRDLEATARSWSIRWVPPWTMMYTYAFGIVTTLGPFYEGWTWDVSFAMVTNMHANIQLFLKDKEYTVIDLDNDPKAGFTEAWNDLGCEGDLDAAVAEWDTKHNPSSQYVAVRYL